VVENWNSTNEFIPTVCLSSPWRARRSWKRRNCSLRGVCRTLPPVAQKAAESSSAAGEFRSQSLHRSQISQDL